MEVIEVKVGTITLDIQLNESDTASELLSELPIRSRVRRWGDEIYFPTPVDMDVSADAQEIVEVGDVAFWPPDQALCLFFGPTPCSQNGKPQAASAVNVVGKLLGDVTILARVTDNSQIEVRLKT
ncbi:hypothetical protein MACH09_08310 [Vibrio sp. MACH09]|uniref:cyclophilin-like fold protein n=1 Tax=Vibrio sp. MACH09 TaxID=3025122 RepID=UPI002790E58F|nr:cyclophilin-like fold protein [Vibrio sp. MACH09]GLO60323.1 hypothetical protein MACH09_08310 [Vibrio sp. MACH09]